MRTMLQVVPVYEGVHRAQHMCRIEWRDWGDPALRGWMATPRNFSCPRPYTERRPAAESRLV